MYSFRKPKNYGTAQTLSVGICKTDTRRGSIKLLKAFIRIKAYHYEYDLLVDTCEKFCSLLNSGNAKESDFTMKTINVHDIKNLCSIHGRKQ